MASADVREELSCSICLDVYKDPVTLRCGHNFCQVCINRVLDAQEASGSYSCLDCREKIEDRSALYRNITLHNIAEHFICAQPTQEENTIVCTYCDFSVAAVKTCLLCEASLCGKHLIKHSKSPEHVLVDPSTSLESRKCPIHKKILEYYCTKDATCICVTCCLVGDHGGHTVESIDDAAQKKHKMLRSILKELTSKKEQVERKIQSLLRQKKKAGNKVTGETGRITALFKDLRKQMDDLEKRALSEIDRQEEQITLSISDMIQQQETKKDKLSNKMHYIEKLCNSTDPLVVLMEQESEMTVPCGLGEVESEDSGKDSNVLCDVGELDKNLISLTLHSGLNNMVSCLKNNIHIEEAVDMSLDINTVSNFLQIDDNLKRAFYTKSQQHPDSPERFEDCQVLSTQSFSSGQHFWEVETSKTGNWMIGVAYASIERKGVHSFIGNNNKSWCLCKVNKKYSVMHDGKTVQLPDRCSSQRLVIYLDYKAGSLSFYELSEAVRHLYTFSNTFTQPLHAAFYIWDEWLKIRS